MRTLSVWFWVGTVAGVFVAAGVRDIRCVMQWKSGSEHMPSRLGAPVFYLIMAAVVVIVVLIFLLLVLTGKGNDTDLDDDHLFTMPGR